MALQITHDPTSHRFTTQADGHEAELVYRLQGQALVIEHTGVPAAIGGRGIAADLVRTALDYARAQGLRVVTACSYSAEFVKRHPQYAHLVDA